LFFGRLHPCKSIAGLRITVDVEVSFSATAYQYKRTKTGEQGPLDTNL
jgi:hypothetical protein